MSSRGQSGLELVRSAANDQEELRLHSAMMCNESGSVPARRRVARLAWQIFSRLETSWTADSFAGEKLRFCWASRHFKAWR
eukprot:Skav230541  [mRNA]  locus=scaffold1183:399182:403006:- [translate_table: standard]